MPVNIIDFAPQPRVLRDRDEEVRTVLERLMTLSQYFDVILNVLQDIKAADRIKLVFKGDVFRIDLHKLHERNLCFCELNTRQINIRSGQVEVLQFRQGPQYRSVPAADLEDIRGFFPQKSLETFFQDFVSRLVPEIVSFEIRQDSQRFGMKS